jgi:hypothetical protein
MNSMRPEGTTLGKPTIVLTDIEDSVRATDSPGSDRATHFER